MERAAHVSLRGFIEDLTALGWLRDVDKSVEKDWEIACIGRWAMEAMREQDAYAIRFNDVAGSDVPVVIGLYGSRRLIARSLGVQPADIFPRWARALDGPLEPRLVDQGPVKDVALRGDEVDLTHFPVPVWTPGRDRAPYIPTACVITADRKDGVHNVGTYRVEVQGPRRLGLSFGSELQHGAMHRKTWEDAGEPTPVALVVGASPAVSFAAAAKLRYGVDELTIAGGLLERPVDVVACETSALRVPAETEIVIEGFLRCGERADEGPFGEALGYMEGVGRASVMDVECITHRAKPILHGLVQQVPTTEGHLLMEMGLLGSLWHYLKGRARIEGLVDLALVEGAAGVSAIAAAVRQGDRESAQSILKVLAMMNWGQKLVIVVDDDIDLRDPKSLIWAITSRSDYANDVTIQPDVPLFQWDPAAFARWEGRLGEDRDVAKGSRMLIDATMKKDCLDVSLPSRSLMERTRANWSETGLPALEGVEHLELLLGKRSEGGIEYRLPRQSKTVT